MGQLGSKLTFSVLFAWSLETANDIWFAKNIKQLIIKNESSYCKTMYASSYLQKEKKFASY